MPLFEAFLEKEVGTYFNLLPICSLLRHNSDYVRPQVLSSTHMSMSRISIEHNYCRQLCGFCISFQGFHFARSPKYVKHNWSCLLFVIKDASNTQDAIRDDIKHIQMS